MIFLFAMHMLIQTTLAATSPGKFQEDLALLRRQPETAARRVQEGKLLFYTAKVSAGKVDRRGIYENGVKVTEAVLKEDPNNPGALYWWVAHQGGLAETGNPLEALPIAKEIERALLRLRDIDSKFEFAGADRVLAYVYDAAPPLISVGSAKKARQHRRQAYSIAPDYPPNLIDMAKDYLADGEKLKARELARAALNSQHMKTEEFDSEEWATKAKKILEKAKEL